MCAESQANAGACPENTRVGRVSALAGAGDAPVALGGTVSLTGPVDGGLAGLAIAIPGRVGPVDLGTVIVRASIALRPDGGLSVRTSPMPALVGGVPVSIRQLAFTFDRPGFILNSSSCAPQTLARRARGVRRRHRDGHGALPGHRLRRPAVRAALEATIGARNRTKTNGRSRRCAR